LRETGFTITSLTATWSGVVPSIAATLSCRPLTLIVPLPAVLSPVSIAQIVAPALSPTKRMPAGPNASGPAEVSDALPGLSP